MSARDRVRGRSPTGRLGQLSALQRAVLDDVPPKYQAIVRRAFTGTNSPREAVKAFCLTCVGFVRSDVTDCPALGCPLWAYRPYQAGDDSEDQ